MYKGIKDVLGWKSKLIKRILSLVIPWLTWNLIWIVIIWLMGKLNCILGEFSRWRYTQVTTYDQVVDMFISSKANPPVWFIQTLLMLHIIGICLFIIAKSGWLVSLVIEIGMIFFVLEINPGYTTPLFWMPVYFMGVIIAVYEDELFQSGIMTMIKQVPSIYKDIIGFFFFLIIGVLAYMVSFDYPKLYYLWRIVGSMVFAMCLMLFSVKKDALWSKLKDYSFWFFMTHYFFDTFMRFVLRKLVQKLEMPSIVCLGVWCFALCFVLLLIFSAGYLIRKNRRCVFDFLIGGR